MNKLLKVLRFKCCTPTSIFKEKCLRKDMLVFRCRHCNQAFVSSGERIELSRFSDAQLAELEFCVAEAQLAEHKNAV